MALRCSTARGIAVSQLRAFRTSCGNVNKAILTCDMCNSSGRSASFRFRGRALRISASATDETTVAEGAPAAGDVTKLDIRVGKIISVESHPDADTLYVEQINLGEAEGPRTIVSGLRKYVTVEALLGRSVLVLANLKPRNMRGIKSNGMLLCASNADHTEVEPLSPPDGAEIGERVYFGDDGADQPEAALPNQLQKKKFWEACQPLLKTDSQRVAQFEGKTMLTKAGPVVAASLADANIS